MAALIDNLIRQVHVLFIVLFKRIFKNGALS